MKKISLLLLFFILIKNLCAGSVGEQPFVALDLQNVSVRDALQIIARQLKQNIVINSTVNGYLSLHFHDMTAQQAFYFILASQGLTKFQQEGIWFIEPNDVLIRQKQTEVKQKEILFEAEPLLTHVWQIRYAQAESIAHFIYDANHSLLSKRGSLQVDGRTNQLCVRDTQENLSEITRLVQRLDIPVKQVLIEARLASVDSDFERELGIDFSAQSGTQVDRGRYSLAIVKLANGSFLDMQLTALENEGHAELISSPSLFTANQQTASIESGEEIPYQEISRSGATGVAFKKAVLSLKVTPQILPNDKVQLQLQINQDRPSPRMVLGVPAITTRQISSSVLAANGQTIVLGGIFESSNGSANQRIPFLGKIPLIGLLFQQQNKTENKRELLIFITPKIVDN